MPFDATVGGANANSYVTREEADTYFAERNITEWAAASTFVRESSLIKATDYIERIYRTLWLGYRTTTTQALSWPRNGVYDELGNALSTTEIPAEVRKATSE